MQVAVLLIHPLMLRGPYHQQLVRLIGLHQVKMPNQVQALQLGVVEEALVVLDQTGFVLIRLEGFIDLDRQVKLVQLELPLPSLSLQGSLDRNHPNLKRGRLPLVEVVEPTLVTKANQ